MTLQKLQAKGKFTRKMALPHKYFFRYELWFYLHNGKEWPVEVINNQIFRIKL